MYGVRNSNVAGFAADVASRHQRYQDARNAQTQQNILKRGNLLSQAGFKQLSGGNERHSGFEETAMSGLDGGGSYGTIKAIGVGLKTVAGKIRNARTVANNVANRTGRTEDEDVPGENDYELDTTGVTRTNPAGIDRGGGDLFENNPLDSDTMPQLGRQGTSLPSDYDNAPAGSLDAPAQATTDATSGIADLGESATMDTVLEGVGGFLEAAAGPLGILMGAYALGTGIYDLVEGAAKEHQGEDIDKKANAMAVTAKPTMENVMDKYVAPVSSAI